MAKKTYSELKGDPSKKDVWIYHPDDVVLVEGRNIRQVIDQNWVDTLAELIKENGQIEAVQGKVNGDKFEVVDGHHRVLAIKKLHTEGHEIPVLVRGELMGTNEEQRIVNQIIANRKLHLNPLDAAEGIRRLYSYNWDNERIAKKIGVTPAYVSKLKELNESPFEFRELVRMEVISGTEAIKIITKGQIEQFLEKYNNGEYNEQPTIQQLTIEPGEEQIAEQKPKRLTAKSLKLDAPNSQKIFKKWAAASNTTTNNMPIHKKEFFLFLMRMQNNEVTEQDIQDFFYKM